MNIESFFRTLIEDWGERELYSIDQKLIEVFLHHGATLVRIEDNNDGTRTTTIMFREKKLVAVSTVEK